MVTTAQANVFLVVDESKSPQGTNELNAMTNFLNTNFSAEQLGTITSGNYETAAPAAGAGDLVIILRTLTNGQYDQNATEVESWNNLAAGILSVSPFLPEGDKLGWSTATSQVDVAAFTGAETLVSNPADPLFAGVTVTGGYADLISDTTAYKSMVASGYGLSGMTVLGSEDTTSATVLARIAAGTAWTQTEGKGSGTHGGNRIVFHYQTDPATANGLYDDLTADGQQVLANAILLLLGIHQAHDPNPEDNETGVPVVNTILSWKAGLDPNDPNVPNPKIIEHYLWLSEPFNPLNPIIPNEWWNATGVKRFTIGADTNPADGQVDPNVSHVVTGLQKDKLYLWFVDEGLVGSSGPDESDLAKIIWGDFWRFETVKSGPVVDAGDSIVTWLKNGSTTVDLNGIVTDSSGDVTVIQWSVLSPPDATVDIANSTVAVTTATLTETGTYLLQLYTKDATNQEDDDAMAIRVYSDSCDAAKNHPDGYTAPEFDFNDDCIENFLDFALFAAKLLEDATLVSDFRHDEGEIALPFLQFTYPPNGAVVSGILSNPSPIPEVEAYDPSVGTANGSGMEGDGYVLFEILNSSGVVIDDKEENNAPWQWENWDTTAVDPDTSLPMYPNGAYTIRVTAVSDKGHTAIAERSVTISNP